MKKPVSTRSLLPDGPAQINAVAEFAEQGWNFRVGTATDRAALASDEKFVGLTWQDTDGAQRRYVWSGSAWVAKAWSESKPFVAVTAPTGIATITHNLGATPDGVNVTLRATGDPALDQVIGWMLWGDPTSTQFQFRIKRTTTGVWFDSSQNISGSYTVTKN